MTMDQIVGLLMVTFCVVGLLGAILVYVARYAR